MDLRVLAGSGASDVQGPDLAPVDPCLDFNSRIIHFRARQVNNLPEGLSRAQDMSGHGAHDVSAASVTTVGDHLEPGHILGS